MKYGLQDQITFGKKHKGETIAEVIESDPGWLDWAIENIVWFVLDNEAYDLLEEALEDIDYDDTNYRGWHPAYDHMYK